MTDQTPADQTPADQTPADQTPADQTPTKQTPTQKKRAYRSSKRQQKAELTRTCIIDAAYTLLGSTRIADLSYVDIGRDAGVSAKTVYRYFPTIDDLLAALAMKASQGMLAQVAGRPPSSIADIPDALASVFSFFEADPAAFRIITAAPTRSAMNVNTVIDTLYGPILDTLPLAQRRPAAALFELLVSPYAWDVVGRAWNNDAAQAARAAIAAASFIVRGLSEQPEALDMNAPLPFPFGPRGWDEPQPNDNSS